MKVNFSKKNSIKLIFVIIIAVGIYYFFSQPVVESLTSTQGQQILNALGTKVAKDNYDEPTYTDVQMKKVKDALGTPNANTDPLGAKIYKALNDNTFRVKERQGNYAYSQVKKNNLTNI